MDKWAGEVIHGYDPANPAQFYGSLIDKLFLTPEDRQREIEDLCEGRTPSFGYAVLAQLIALPAHGFNVVLTTNFDDLIADALYLYTDARPLVIHHESLATFIRPTRTRPLVVKLHGDHRLSPRNTALETETLAREIQRHTAMVLHDRGLIFMGYGGADHGILKMLYDLPGEALPFGAYWVHPEEPQGQVREWLASRHGIWVRSGWFDEVMLLVRNAFDLPHPSPNRFTRIFDEYQEKFKALSAAIQQKPNSEAGVPALKKAVTNAEAALPGYYKPLFEAYRLQDKDPDRADKIYSHAVAQFPTAVPLLSTYAFFIYRFRKDDIAAEAMYKQALEADPQHSATLGSYALFLHEARKNDIAAEAMYKRALDADPKQPNNLGNYANFLKTVRKDYVAAEAMYKRALDADPKQPINLVNYAMFLRVIRKDHAAAEAIYKRALDADPKSAVILGDYAIFLETGRQNYDLAEAMYKRALEIDPTEATNIGNYALFLKRVRKDYEAANAMYKRAIETDPKHGNNLGNYANFLDHIRKDYSAAEAMYKRALDADPSNISIQANFAGFLCASGRAEGISMLHQAINMVRENPQSGDAIECAFYLFAHGLQDDRPVALHNARRLIELGVRSPGWDFSRNIERARLDGHPDAPWLGKLTSVITDESKPGVLNGWPAWANAAT